MSRSITAEFDSGNQTSLNSLSEIDNMKNDLQSMIFTTQNELKSITGINETEKSTIDDIKEKVNIISTWLDENELEQLNLDDYQSKITELQIQINRLNEIQKYNENQNFDLQFENSSQHETESQDKSNKIAEQSSENNPDDLNNESINLSVSDHKSPLNFEQEKLSETNDESGRIKMKRIPSKLNNSDQFIKFDPSKIHKCPRRVQLSRIKLPPLESKEEIQNENNENINNTNNNIIHKNNEKNNNLNSNTIHKNNQKNNNLNSGIIYKNNEKILQSQPILHSSHLPPTNCSQQQIKVIRIDKNPSALPPLDKNSKEKIESNSNLNNSMKKLKPPNLQRRDGPVFRCTAP